MRRRNPLHLSPGAVMVSREETTRVRAFIFRVGFGRAAKSLGIGLDTLEAARDQGRLLAKTHERLLEALAREEAKLP